MSARGRMRQRCVVHTPTEDQWTEDDYGNEEISFEATETACLLANQGSTEQETDRETRTQSYLLMVPVECNITASSYVTWDDPDTEEEREARVLGEPILHPRPHGGYSHREANLQEILG